MGIGTVCRVLGTVSVEGYMPVIAAIIIAKSAMMVDRETES